MSIQLIQQYYAQVDKLIRYGGSRNESTLRKAFQDLLEKYAHSKNLELVPEVEFTTKSNHRVVPDGTLKDALRQDWGYWESKDEKDDLKAEIDAKFAKGYPSTNILFEDTRTAVLYQSGLEIMRADFLDPHALNALLIQFVGYELPEVREFHKAIEQFSSDVPGLAKVLREVIDDQYLANNAFKTSLDEFLELSRKAINPKVEMADVREMVIQHVLTEDIFMRVFDEADFHRDNVVAHKLQEVAGTFYKGATKRNIDARLAPYYQTINARAAQISDHHEKQKFLKALYENFYKAYNPKAADRLGVIYTPDEIVRFMIESTDTLLFTYFGKTLGDKYVEILDPATGTGTFITELIEYLPPNQLDFKYEHEIHCNEVAILPYYIANLNIEYTYKQKMGQYKEFENICFVDTLDNVGFTKSGEHQMDFFGLWDENAERIKRQNRSKISVVIGNPPYNTNQLNENENNKNREYPEIDGRIKQTYIKQSSAQKTKLYDMYARFIRWASDRLAQDGIIAFVSNNSFLNARSYDGFRKVVGDEFNYIYIIDLKGDARTSGEQRRKEGGNVFNDQIRVGVAVYFFVRKKGVKGCKIFYNTIHDSASSKEKQDYLCNNNLFDLSFIDIHPDQKNNWLDLTDNDWGDLIPLASKETKFGSGIEKKQAIFKLFSLGIVSNRDEWAYDFSSQTLSEKVNFFFDRFNTERTRWQISDKKIATKDFVDRTIKWTSELETHMERGTKLVFNNDRIRKANYRPFVKSFVYYDRVFIHRTYQYPEIFPIGEDYKNKVLCVNVGGKPFNVICTDEITDLHFNGDAQCFPLVRYVDDQEIENITDWSLNKFQKYYRDKKINKQSIFHYVYAVLHHPAYRSKYAQNLKREFPRIPFYENFWQWAKWGETLMELHLHYEKVPCYPLQREDKDPAQIRTAIKPILIARKEKGLIEIDTLTTLSGVPKEVWDYRLGTYSAVEWILERYKEKTPKDPTIREMFNTYRFADYKEEVIDLILRVCTVSVETMKIIGQMPTE